jgi:hypothetical protein
MLQYFVYLGAYLTETTPGNHGSQVVYSATSFASSHTIQKLAQLIIIKCLSCMMSLLHVSALQHNRIFLCASFHSHTSCTVLFLICSCYEWGIQIYFTVHQNDIYFAVVLDYTLHHLMYCSCTALT